MRILRPAVLAAVLLVLLVDRSAEASWIAVPLEKRVEQADLVVVGEIVATEEIRSETQKRGKLRITEVLKGGSAPKTVPFVWSGPKTVVGPDGRESTMVHSAMIPYKKGDKGIWILRRDPKTGEYTANYPGNLIREAGNAKYAEKLKQIRQLATKKARAGIDTVVNGLQLSILAEKEKFRAKEPVSFTMLLTNRTEKTIQVSDSTHPFGRFGITLKGPDGKEIPGPRFKLTPLKPVSISLFPGASYGRIYAVSAWHAVKRAGKYSFTVRYAATEKAEGRWQGILQAKPLSFEILPPPEGPDPHEGLEKIKLSKDWTFEGTVSGALAALQKELHVPIQAGEHRILHSELKKAAKWSFSSGQSLETILTELLDAKVFGHWVRDGRVRVLSVGTVETFHRIEKQRKDNGLQLSLELDKDKLEPGKPFSVKVILTHLGGKKLSLVDHEDLLDLFRLTLECSPIPNGEMMIPVIQPLLVAEDRVPQAGEVVLPLLPNTVYVRSFDLWERFIPQVGEGVYHRLTVDYSVPKGVKKDAWSGTVSVPSRPLFLIGLGRNAEPRVKMATTATVATPVALGEKPRPAEIRVRLDGTITNKDEKPLAVTLESLHLVQGSTAHRLGAELATPVLQAGEVWTVRLKAGATLSLTEGTVQVRLVFSDFAGKRYEVTTEEVKIKQE